jgi:CHAD domain-containing protein
MNFQLKAQMPQLALGHSAYNAFQKHFKKSTKYEDGVLADRDPECLHQMRVGMRRLRSAIQVFGFAVKLPETVRDRHIRQFAQVLGAVRDLDVMQMELMTDAELPKTERKKLKQVVKELLGQRSQDFKHLKKTLKSDEYQTFKRDFEDWLSLPKYKAIAQLPMQEVGPDLLLPLVSQILLHPAWLVGIQFESEQIEFSALTPELIRKQLKESGEQLHDLRKQMKRLCYQMELFVDLYGDEYKTLAEEIKTIQEVLGHIQDSAILQEFLSQKLDKSITEVCPTFSNHLDQKRLDAWQQWRSLQEKYLDADFRSKLRHQIIDIN